MHFIKFYEFEDTQIERDNLLDVGRVFRLKLD